MGHSESSRSTWLEAISVRQKRKPFSDSFVSLGVLMDFTEMHRATLMLRKTLGQIDSIEGQVDTVANSPSKLLTFTEALSLRGKIAYVVGEHIAGSQLFSPIICRSRHRQWAQCR